MNRTLTRAEWERDLDDMVARANRGATPTVTIVPRHHVVGPAVAFHEGEDEHFGVVINAICHAIAA